MKIPVKVLEYKGGTFDDDTGRSVTYSNAFVQIEGREYKLKAKIDMKKYEGLDGEATVDMSPSKQLPVLTIVDFEEN